MSEAACRDTQGLSVHTILLSRPVSQVASGDTRVVTCINTVLLSRPMCQVAGRDSRVVILTNTVLLSRPVY